MDRPLVDVVWSTNIIIGSFVKTGSLGQVAHSDRLVTLAVHDVLDGKAILPGVEIQAREAMVMPVSNPLERASGQTFVLFLTYDGCTYRLRSEALSPSVEDIQQITDLVARRTTLPEAAWVKKLLLADRKDPSQCADYALL